MDFVWVALGLVLLTVGADLLVRGAIALSLRLGVSALIIGLTVVAFGTSAPELLVSAEAVLNGKAELALGNVIGSNIANILLVLGIPACIASLSDSDEETRINYRYMLLATLGFVALAAISRQFNALTGVILFAGLGAFLWKSWLTGKAEIAQKGATELPDELDGVSEKEPWFKIIGLMLLGLIALPFGADWLVYGASNIAARIGVSDAVIGLTLVAVGTSLPELATCIIAVLRGNTKVAIGNVIGSNIFNLLGIAGFASLIGTIEVVDKLWVSLFVMVLATFGLGYFIWYKKRITNIFGAIFAILYALYAGLALAGQGGI